MKAKTKRQIQTILGLFFAIGFLYLALKDVNINEILSRLANINLIYLPLCLVFYALFFWLKAIRWHLLVTPIKKLSTKEVFPALMIGFMGNNVLPAHLGEFLRMYVLSKEKQISKTSVLSTIILERVLDFLVITATLAVVLQFIPLSENLHKIRMFGYLIGLGNLTVFIFFLFYVWQTERALHLTEMFLSIAPKKIRNRILIMLNLGIKGLYSIRNPWILLVMLLLTAIHWSLNAGVLYLAAISFPAENNIPLLAAPLLMCICALGVTLPNAPGFFGTIQACFKYSLIIFNISPETAFAGSIYALLIGYIPVTLLGFFFLGKLNLKLSTIRQEADSAEDSEADNEP